MGTLNYVLNVELWNTNVSVEWFEFCAGSVKEKVDKIVPEIVSNFTVVASKRQVKF